MVRRYKRQTFEELRDFMEQRAKGKEQRWRQDACAPSPKPYTLCSKMTLISACLVGINCMYNGASDSRQHFIEQIVQGNMLPICPEQLGGLPTPRSPSEIAGGTGEDVLDNKARIYTKYGVDVTQAFLRGANETLYLARLVGAELIILKQNSPSCGCGRIYDGTFTGTLREGNGVTAALLLRENIRIEAIAR